MKIKTWQILAFTLKNSKNNVNYFFVKHPILISRHFVIVGWILDIDTCNVILVVHVMVIVQVHCTLVAKKFSLCHIKLA